MKQYLNRLVLKIDSLSLRERAIIFALAALILVTLINSFLLEPLFNKQKLLSQQVQQDQQKIAEIQNEIQQKIKLRANDPNSANRQRLDALLHNSMQMQNALKDMQKDLVSPDKMAELLESILKRNGNLRLISLKTLPPMNLTDPNGLANKAVGEKASDSVGSQTQNTTDKETPSVSVFQHGVEITLQGNYMDMMSYMSELESMPWRLFWGKAKLTVGDYPNSTLVLTLFTLSLDKRWLNI